MRSCLVNAPKDLPRHRFSGLTMRRPRPYNLIQSDTVVRERRSMWRPRTILEGTRLRADRLHPMIGITLLAAILMGHRAAMGELRSAVNGQTTASVIDVSSYSSDRAGVLARK